MLLWKIETKTVGKRKIANPKLNQPIHQPNQFQDGTYEKMLVMLKLNKREVQAKVKRPAKRTSTKETI